MKASEIIASVEATLVDPENQFWPVPELIGYINEAVRTIAYYRPEANAITESLTLAAGTRQKLPELGTRLIDIPRNIAGPAITSVDQRDLDRMVRDWPQMPPAATVEHYMYDDRFPRVFSVYPPATTETKVEVIYAATLADIDSTTDAVPLGGEYRTPVIEYVLYRAHSKDTEQAITQRAQAHYANFAQMLGMAEQAAQAVAAGEPDDKNPRELR